MPVTVAGFVKNGVVVPNAPLPEGAQVEIRLAEVSQEMPPEGQSFRPAADAAREKARATALDQFLALARSSSFRSAGPYPTRDELHERP